MDEQRLLDASASSQQTEIPRKGNQVKRKHHSILVQNSCINYHTYETAKNIHVLPTSILYES